MFKPAEKRKNKTPVTYYAVNADEAFQRIDNFLITYFKKIPKGHIYKLLRKGEVRVNSKRVAATYKLKEGDKIRIPPVHLEQTHAIAPPATQTTQLLTDRILYEDDFVLVLNKPHNMSVHAGSTVRMGVIEILKHAYPKLPQLELAHRLDADTSGCLIIAKKKRVLRALHQLLREGKMIKIYWALTAGHFKKAERVANFPLHKEFQTGGKHVVRVNKDGKEALTYFRPITQFKHAELTEATLSTGRTHQIRVHAAHLGHPIAGDARYGSVEFNKESKAWGLKRMFLHARSIEFTLPSEGQRIRVVAPLDDELTAVLSAIDPSISN